MRAMIKANKKKKKEQQKAESQLKANNVHHERTKFTQWTRIFETRLTFKVLMCAYVLDTCVPNYGTCVWANKTHLDVS